MDRSAHSALPSPYSKIFPAFGAGAAVTHAAVLGGKRFINFIKPHACVSAFILQHGSKCAPARIEHRLGQSGLCESGGIHVADEDSTVGLDQVGAQFMQEIFSPIRDLGVNRSGSGENHRKRIQTRNARRYPSLAIKARVSREELR